MKSLIPRVLVRSFLILTLLLVFASSPYASAPASAAPIITEIPLPPNNYQFNPGPLGIINGPGDGKLWFSLNGLSAIGSMTTTPDHTLKTYPITTDAEAIDIHLGPDGLGHTVVWFAEYHTDKIGRVNTDGSVQEFTIPGMTTTTQGTWMVTDGPDGNIWFTEYFNHSIGRMSPNGTNYVGFDIGNTGSQPSEIIPGPDGNLWFADEGGSAIGRITTAGVITMFPLADNRGPCGLTAGPDGNVWFAEQDFGTLPGKYIGKITPQGTITEYPTPSTNAGPVEMTVGPDGNIWFAEGVANKLAESTLTGQITEYDVPTANAQPYSLVTAPDGKIWFTETTANQIGIFDLYPISAYLPLMSR